MASGYRDASKGPKEQNPQDAGPLPASENEHPQGSDSSTGAGSGGGLKTGRTPKNNAASQKHNDEIDHNRSKGPRR